MQCLPILGCSLCSGFLWYQTRLRGKHSGRNPGRRGADRGTLRGVWGYLNTLRQSVNKIGPEILRQRVYHKSRTPQQHPLSPPASAADPAGSWSCTGATCSSPHVCVPRHPPGLQWESRWSCFLSSHSQCYVTEK